MNPAKHHDHAEANLEEALNRNIPAHEQITRAIVGLAHAVLALTPGDEAVAEEPGEPAPAVQDKPMSTVPYDGTGPSDWLCEGSDCPIRHHEHPWQAHIHRIAPCRDVTCQRWPGHAHAHLTKDNIVSYTGAPCTADDCSQAEYQHAHWFAVNDPDTPGKPRWLVKAT